VKAGQSAMENIGKGDYRLMKVALGEAEADLAIVNGGISIPQNAD